MATARRRVAIARLSCVGARAARRSAQAFSRLAQSPTFGVGHAPKPEELKQIDIDVTPDGKGLPPGSGTAAAGKDVYTRRCETCHGPTGKEGPQDVLAGGKGSLATPKPQKTVGSYWPYATTLWDYINRAMPFDHPSTLTPDEVYSADRLRALPQRHRRRAGRARPDDAAEGADAEPQRLRRRSAARHAAARRSSAGLQALRGTMSHHRWVGRSERADQRRPSRAASSPATR